MLVSSLDRRKLTKPNPLDVYAHVKAFGRLTTLWIRVWRRASKATKNARPMESVRQASEAGNSNGASRRTFFHAQPQFRSVQSPNWVHGTHSGKNYSRQQQRPVRWRIHEAIANPLPPH